MSDYINAADQDDFLNPDNWGLDDADWALMQQHAAQDWATVCLTVPTPMPLQGCGALAGSIDAVEVSFHGAATPSSNAAPSISEILPTARNQQLSNTRKNPRKDLQLKCPHADCTHTATFARQYELDRHIRVKHNSKKPFFCPFPGCFNRTAVTSYARSDKLTSHIRNVHSRHADKLLDCCVKNCTRTSLPIDLLAVHIRQAHGIDRYNDAYPPRDEAARGLLAAGSTAFRQCPLWRCAKQLRLESFMDHLTAHTIVELSESMDVLESDGYRINMKSPADEPVHWPLEQSEGNGKACAVVVQVECPICHQPFKSHKSLQEHINEAHIVAEGQRGHFRIWNQHLSGKFKLGYKFMPWQTWRRAGSGETLACPCCQHRERFPFLNHQRSMLADPEDLKPYRRAILRLYPEFATHPVWKDLA